MDSVKPTDWALKVYPDGRGGRCFSILDRGPQMLYDKVLKGIILDIDGLVEPPYSPPPYVLYLEEIFKVPSIGEKRGVIKQDSAGLQTGRRQEHYMRLNKTLRDCGLTKSIHDEACYAASRKVEVKLDYRDTMLGLKERAYEPLANSASPTDLLVQASDVLQIEPENIRGSDFLFDGSGLFAGFIPNLGATRARSRDELLYGKVKAKNGFEITADDKSGSVAPIAKQAWNHAYLVFDSKEPMSESVSVSVPDASHKLTAMLPKIDQIEDYIGILVTMYEDDYRGSHEAVHWMLGKIEDMKRAGRRQVLQDKDDLAWRCKDYLRMMGPMAQGADFIRSAAEELRLESGEYSAMKKLSKLESLLRGTREAALPLGSF